VLAPSLATADDFERCVSAFEQAQVERKKGGLLKARLELMICVQPTCPIAARQDCTRWLDEVDAALPTVVIEARDAHGREVRDVRVLVDSGLVATHLDGKAISVDPGTHSFHFELAGASPVDQQIVIREGQKNRQLGVRFDRGPAPSAPSAGPRPVPPLAIVLAGVGVASLGAFAVFGAKSLADEDKLETECAPDCSPEDADPIATERIVADVCLGVGIAALVGAAIVFLSRPTRPSEPTARAAQPRAMPVPWRVTF